MSTNMKELLEAGVHFGHQTQRWNPKMDNYIYGDKSGIHILDLRITYDAIAKAEDFVQKIVANGGKVLFVGTKPQAQNVIQEQAESAGMPFVNHRRLGGMLTNFKTIIKRVIYLTELIPDAIFIVDLMNESTALTEANKLGIPVIGLADSNVDPTGVDIVIPGNDDAIRSIEVVTSAIAEACAKGAGLEAVKAEKEGE